MPPCRCKIAVIVLALGTVGCCKSCSRRRILRLHDEIGLDYLLCAPLSHQSFMLLTEKVLPRIA